MKKVITIITLLLFFISILAQTPQAFNYQTVIRDANGNPLTDQMVALRISLLEDAIDGTAIYIETHTHTTNEFGLINLEIGNGIPGSGDFTTIDWGNHTYFLKIEMDAAGGSNFILMGTFQLFSVPYA